MNRRSFLQSVGALAVGAMLPSALAARESVGWRFLTGPVILNSDWMPGFVSITRRGQWRDAYRAWRKDGRPGGDYARARDIWGAYGRTLDTSYSIGEIGRVDDVRFIVSEAVA